MMYMHQVEVIPDYRQLGIGKKLMEAFINLCEENDCERLFLIKSNEAAINFYNSIGGKTFHDDDILNSFSI